MSRPSSSSFQNRPEHRSSTSGSLSMGGEGMTRVPTYSPTPSTSQQVFYPNQGYYAQPGSSYQQMRDPSMSNMAGEMTSQHQGQHLGHPAAQGRMAVPLQGNSGVVSVNPHGHKKRSKTPTPSPNADNNCGPSPFLPEDESPFIRPINLPPHFEVSHSINHMSGDGMHDIHYQVTPAMNQAMNQHLTASHLASYGIHNASPEDVVHQSSGYMVSPTEQIRMQHLSSHLGGPSNGQHSEPMSRPNSQGLQPGQPRQRPATQQGRPLLTQRHTMQLPQQRPAHLQRQMSLQHPTAQSASPHLLQGDIFDPMPMASPSPNLRPSSSLGFVENHAGPSGYHPDSMGMNFDFQPQEIDPSNGNGQFYSNSMQGISPARALGPAPPQPLRFSPHSHDDPMITPQMQKKIGYPNNGQSSATSSTANSHSSTLSSASSGSNFTVISKSVADRRNGLIELSDDDNDSPTKGLAPTRSIKRIPVDNIKTLKISAPLDDRQGSKPGMLINRPVRPLSRPVPTSMGAGRTSAKFAKVAEDPGVEGVPPGPRPMDRPGPSFACIIGQAILKCKAGGLSLEHIYRYVETAYPYFKTGDGAWRNSVRHNLSIHKMFETIPRTEKFPAGKGGIWIIHEDEKCHWPEDNKFIKNFPATHPHHANCRQTLHERQKEQEAMDRAAREGRAYVPKKGKKGRKLPNKDDDDDEGVGMEMTGSSSSMGDNKSSVQLPQRIPLLQSLPNQQHRMMHPPPRPVMQSQTSQPFARHSTPLQPTQQLPPLGSQSSQHHFAPHPSSDFEDDGDFLPLDMESYTDSCQGVISDEIIDPIFSHEDELARSGMMVPPRFERIKNHKRKPTTDDDIENVFAAPKYVRVAEPLAPIMPPPQERLLPGLDDSYVTPERAGISQNHKSTMSSSFKTPALVQTSSSPGSSPMPTSILRGPHHPSSLQQAWTHDDADLELDHLDHSIEIAAPSSTPAAGRTGLDSAFDFKPLSAVHGTRSTRTHHLQDEDHMSHPTSSIHLPGPPKTPASRSSAATEKTPRHFRTPGPLPLGSMGGSLGAGVKTPAGGYASSPGMMPPSAGHLLSTPLWDIENCLTRLKSSCSNFGSPTRSPSARNTVPSTSPTRYAMLLPPVDGSPARKPKDGLM